MKLTVMILSLSVMLLSVAHGQSISALPGHYYHSLGEDAYKRGNHERAREMFELSAHWGDKLSQFNVGVMHYQGQSVPQDKVLAWAWLAVSAERGYQRMEHVASQVWGELDEAERGLAEQRYEQLRAEIGDAVAVPRAQRRMDQQRRKMTGSRVGMIGNLTIIDAQTGERTRGENFYNPRFYNYARMMEEEELIMDVLHRGRVELRELKLIDD